MLSTLDILFGWMPPLIGTLSFSATVIFVALVIFSIIRSIKDLIPFA